MAVGGEWVLPGAARHRSICRGPTWHSWPSASAAPPCWICVSSTPSSMTPSQAHELFALSALGAGILPFAEMNVCYLPLLVVQGIYHYRKYLFFFFPGGLKHMEGLNKGLPSVSRQPVDPHSSSVSNCLGLNHFGVKKRSWVTVFATPLAK